MSDATPLVSVVVPVRNGAGRLPSLFAALEAQTLDPEAVEVVVVDDGSTDDSAAVAAAWAAQRPERRRVVAGSGRGPAHARNLGIGHARGEWVASTDADVVPSADWLEQALAALERTGADALEGAIDALPPGRAGAYSTLQLNHEGGRYMTGNMVYRRSVLAELGGFDERFAEQFLEDSDLAFRILDTGREIPFAPEARVAHPVLDVPAAAVLRSARRTRWLALFAAKHPERYRTQLRPLVRPLTPIDVDVVVGLVALAAAGRARGTPRLVLLATAALGLKRGLGSGRLEGLPPGQLPERVGVALALPPLRAFWWLAGCLRFRRFVW